MNKKETDGKLRNGNLLSSRFGFRANQFETDQQLLDDDII